MNRFFSATSISRLIMMPTNTRHAVRARTRANLAPGPESEQTHDDCEWLNEEDGEEDVLWHWRDGYRG